MEPDQKIWEEKRNVWTAPPTGGKSELKGLVAELQTILGGSRQTDEELSYRELRWVKGQIWKGEAHIRATPPLAPPQTVM